MYKNFCSLILISEMKWNENYDLCLIEIFLWKHSQSQWKNTPVEFIHRVYSSYMCIMFHAREISLSLFYSLTHLPWSLKNIQSSSPCLNFFWLVLFQYVFYLLSFLLVQFYFFYYFDGVFFFNKNSFYWHTHKENLNQCFSKKTRLIYPNF